MSRAGTPRRGPWSNERSTLLALSRRDEPDDERRAALRRAEPERLVALAADHRVVGMLRREAARLDVALTTDATRQLEWLVVIATARRLHLEHTLNVVAEALDVPFLVVKGPVLAQWYDDPDERDYGDLDVLVRRSDFCSAVSSLETGSFDVLLSNWETWRDDRIGELPLGLQHSVVDLHWSLIATGRDRHGLALPELAMFDRSASVDLDTAVSVPTLDPVDTLVHLCTNTGLGGGRRLRNLVDIDVVLRSGQVDLAEFTDRARSAGVGRLAGALLSRCRRLLGTPVATDVLEDLAPSRAWLAANRLVEQRATALSTSSIAPGLLLSSGRRSTWTTTRAFARSLRAAVAGRVQRDDSADRPGRLDWTMTPADGRVAAHRERYLRWVDSED